jgi:hypothetical protein
VREWIHDRAGGAPQPFINHRRPTPAAQEDFVNNLILAGFVVALGFAPTFAVGQTSDGGSQPRDRGGAPGQEQREEMMLVGEVQSVDESGTELTLTDGTKLLTPPGSRFRPGSLGEGMLVIAMYREEENGNKILTRLSLGQREPTRR